MDKTATPVTDTYLYGNTNWKDLLTNYNGTSINYDAIGNPSNWRDGLTFSWINGRQLGTVKKNGSAVGTYTYDSTGMRIKKTAGGVTTTYHVMNGVCYGETRSDGRNLQYVFDENGRVIGFRVQRNGGSNRYYFVFNAQGDVVQLLHANGNVVANYTYDTWGRCTATSGTGGTLSSTDIGSINPFRYRGYYYDTETGLYYLQSRYYDPVIGRFVNADGQLMSGSAVGMNLFAYCNNNPVNYCDPDGHLLLAIVGIGLLTVGLIIGCTSSSSDSSSKDLIVDGISQAQPSIAYGSIIMKNFKNGWDVRIDSGNTNTKTQRHIHIEKGNKMYAQNEDGTPHDGSSGTPPQKVIKKLKENNVWDWEGNELKQSGIPFDSIVIQRQETFRVLGANPTPLHGPFFSPAASGGYSPLSDFPIPVF